MQASMKYRKSFWFYLKTPIFLVADILGIMSHNDKANIVDGFFVAADEFDKIDKRLKRLERRLKK